jgi:hypothetical protein
MKEERHDLANVLADPQFSHSTSALKLTPSPKLNPTLAIVRTAVLEMVSFKNCLRVSSPTMTILIFWIVKSREIFQPKIIFNTFCEILSRQLLMFLRKKLEVEFLLKLGVIVY